MASVVVEHVVVGVHCPRECVDFITPVTTPMSPMPTPFMVGGVEEGCGVDGGCWAAQLLLVEGWEVHAVQQSTHSAQLVMDEGDVGAQDVDPCVDGMFGSWWWCLSLLCGGGCHVLLHRCMQEQLCGWGCHVLLHQCMQEQLHTATQPFFAHTRTPPINTTTPTNTHPHSGV